jgi:hypothetical protein
MDDSGQSTNKEVSETNVMVVRFSVLDEVLKARWIGGALLLLSD